MASAGLLTAAVVGLGLELDSALVLGGGLALSSTVLVLPMLAEHGLPSAQSGRDSFSILLFQDLAVIPLVALLPLLGEGGAAEPVQAPWAAVAKAAVLAILVGGRFLLRPVFRLVAGARMPEIFTATALLIVMGTTLVVSASRGSSARPIIPAWS